MHGNWESKEFGLRKRSYDYDNAHTIFIII
jgi:hypothetical protein